MGFFRVGVSNDVRYSQWLPAIEKLRKLLVPETPRNILTIWANLSASRSGLSRLRGHSLIVRNPEI